MVPKKLHFIWGYKLDDVFGLVERLAIQSAAHHNADWEVMLWAHRTPEGEQWEKLKRAVPRLKVVGAPPIDVVAGHPIEKYQHKADFLRHALLYGLGGAYMDLDTLTLAPFPQRWLEQPYTVGFEYHADGRPIGLCNAVYLCAPFSAFAWRVLVELQEFDPRIHWYAEFAVNRPLQWAKEMPPGEVDIVRWSLLGPMHWGSAVYWEGDDPLQGVVVAHLWRTFHNDAILRALTEEKLLRANFTYANKVRSYIAL